MNPKLPQEREYYICDLCKHPEPILEWMLSHLSEIHGVTNNPVNYYKKAIIKRGIWPPPKTAEENTKCKTP